MDKLINKVKKDVSNKDLSKAKKDLKVLSKADKKFDTELDEYHEFQKERREKMKRKKK